MKISVSSLSIVIVMAAVIVIFATARTASANPARDAIMAAITAQAQAENPGFAGFSAERGKAFFLATHTGGKPETPSCTSCHGNSPFTVGQTRAGKVIEPLAPSKTPDRYTDPEKVAKWFYRNCRSVLGRECTAMEKGDYLSYMIIQ